VVTVPCQIADDKLEFILQLTILPSSKALNAPVTSALVN
jgi:hypothetical protein